MFFIIIMALILPSGLIAHLVLSYLKKQIQKKQTVYYVKKKDENGKWVRGIYYR